MWGCYTKRKIRNHLLAILRYQRLILRNQRLLEKRLDRIDKTLCKLAFRVKPGPVKVQIVGEEPMDVMIYNVELPPAVSHDVVARKLTVAREGVSPVEIDLPKDALLVENLTGPQDSVVTLSLVDIDDAGNESEPSVATFTLVDNIPPAKPGEIAIAIVGEIHEEDPVEPGEPGEGDGGSEEPGEPTDPVEPVEPGEPGEGDGGGEEPTEPEVPGEGEEEEPQG